MRSYASGKRGESVKGGAGGFKTADELRECNRTDARRSGEAEPV